MGYNKLFLLFLYFIATAAFAQQNRYMVFFKDKTLSPYSTATPIEFLSQRSIDRRERQQLTVTLQDIPVVEEYIQTMRNAGCNVLYKSRWMNGVLVECEDAVVPTLEALSIVKSTELVAPGEKPMSGGRRNVNARTTNEPNEVTRAQNKILGIDEMHKAGYFGEGINIAVMDAGFEGVNVTQPFKLLFDEGRIQLTHDFAYKQDDVYQHDNHGTQVFSTLAAYSPGSFVGGAYKAMYQLYVTEFVSSEYRVEEYNWLFAAERADSAGVDIIQSSLGYNTFSLSSMNYKPSDLDGKTAVITKAAQWSADRGIVVVVSAGNEGSNSWKLITAPADAVDVLAVGSINTAGERANSSSIGPSADGRTKPDVVAVGAGAAVIKANGSTGTANGTSFAAPQVAGLIAGVWQRYPDLTSLQVLEAVRSSASQATTPDNLLGYGVPNFMAIVNKLDWQPQEKLIIVYPNPVTDSLHIRPNDPIAINEARLEILSLQGQIISTKTATFNWRDRTYIADCSELSEGLYILRVWIGAKPFAFKLVKM